MNKWIDLFTISKYCSDRLEWKTFSVIDYCIFLALKINKLILYYLDMSWSSDFLTLIIQNQNFNKKFISDYFSLKNVHDRRHALFFTQKIPADQSKFVLLPTTCISLRGSTV